MDYFDKFKELYDLLGQCLQDGINGESDCSDAKDDAREGDDCSEHKININNTGDVIRFLLARDGKRNAVRDDFFQRYGISFEYVDTPQGCELKLEGVICESLLSLEDIDTHNVSLDIIKQSVIYISLLATKLKLDHPQKRPKPSVDALLTNAVQMSVSFLKQEQ